MNREEIFKKYELYNSALSVDEQVRANSYRKYSYFFLIAAWVSPLLFIGIGSEIKPPLPLQDFQDWMIIIGVILCVVSLGLFLIFGGKDTVLRKYSFGKTRKNTNTYNQHPYDRPLFDAAAVRWGKTKIIAGYAIIISLSIALLTVASAIFFF